MLRFNLRTSDDLDVYEIEANSKDREWKRVCDVQPTSYF